MQKTILITGSTDGIGRETALRLAALGHHILLHGRNSSKLADIEQALRDLNAGGSISSYVADLSRLGEVEALAQAVTKKHDTLDVLINNAGVYQTRQTCTGDDLDVRFAVNTIAPWLLTQQLLPLMRQAGRVINLSSAAQAPVNLEALAGKPCLSDSDAYAQSKLALTMWSRQLAQTLGDRGPVIIAVNPGSMLGSKMVKDAFSVEGADLSIGADILVRTALDEAFSAASGQYYDNDKGAFGNPHPDALNATLSAAVVSSIEAVIVKLGLG